MAGQPRISELTNRKFIFDFTTVKQLHGRCSTLLYYVGLRYENELDLIAKPLNLAWLRISAEVGILLIKKKRFFSYPTYIW